MARGLLPEISNWKKLGNAEFCPDRLLRAGLSPDHNDLDPDGG